MAVDQKGFWLAASSAGHQQSYIVLCFSAAQVVNWPNINN